MTQGDALVEVDNVSKTFRIPHDRYTSLRSRVIHMLAAKGYTLLSAVNHVNLRVERGEFLGVIGRNGSGKSTLLKLLAGIYLPTTGAVRINGSLSPFIELGVGFNNELTARENVFLNGVILGLTRSEISAKFDEIIDFGNLGAFVDQKLKNFSSGMQVRLAFSIAIQANADILLIDEVLAVGDANFQAKCFDVFRRLKASGKTILFVTHDLATMQLFSDRAIVMESGSVAYAGEPRQAVFEYLRLAAASVPLGDEGKGDGALGSGAARVVDAWIDDEHGKSEVMLAPTAPTYSISVRVQFLAELRDPVPGVIVYNAQGHRITASNTFWANVHSGRFSPGDAATFTFTFPNVLEVGAYRVSVNVVHADMTRVLDWHEAIMSFFCPKPFATGGMVNPPYVVTIDRNG